MFTYTTKHVLLAFIFQFVLVPLSFVLWHNESFAATSFRTENTTFASASPDSKEASVDQLSTGLSIVNSVQRDGQVLGTSAFRRVPASVRTRLKKTYQANEAVSVTFTNPGDDQLSMHLRDTNNDDVNAAFDQSTTNGITTLSVLPFKSLKPGKYKLIVSGISGQVFEQDFAWGVLAINTNKSFYHPHETASIEMAVLNELGNMVCDAKVSLRIQNQALHIDETLSTENGKITVNPECYSHEFTLKPDYQTSYDVGEQGHYDMTLTAQTNNGTYTITDGFDVRDYVPFDVERITATRIYPPNSYPVIFKITANEDFSGTLREAIPSEFATSPIASSSSDVTKENYVNQIAQPEATPTPTTTQVLSASDTNDASASPTIAEATNSGEVASSEPSFPITPNQNNQEHISLHMPFAGNYPITQRFGEALTDPLLLKEYRHFGVVGHDGVDFGLPKGTPILAADSGTVIYADIGDYGNTVIIQHSWGRSYYGHLSVIGVKIGQLVNTGDTLGLSGSTGLSTGPHLHFGIKPNAYDDHNGYFGKVDPLVYLNNTVTSAVAGASDTASTILNVSNVSSIDYPVTLKKGQTIQIEYKYLAPQKSPASYLLGPLQFISSDQQVVFQESRQWEIAADAVWLSSSWNYRKAITIDHTKVSSTQTNFPVLISLSSDSDLSAGARSDGFDILFTSSDGSTKLSAERESYSSGTLVAWVGIPSLSSSTDTVIYMYYGNASSCDQTLSSCTTIDGTANKNTVWTNASYAGVWHMQETPTSQPQDSTGNGLTLTYHGTWGAGQSVTSKIAKGLSFNGSSSYLTAADNNILDPSPNYAVSAWIKVTSFGSGLGYWMDHVQSTGSTDYSYRHYYEGTSADPGRFSWDWYNGTSNFYSGGYDSSYPNSVLTAGTFGYVVQTLLSNKFTFYFNGSDDTAPGSPSSSGTMLNADSQLCIGANCNQFGATGNYINAVVDELRLASVGRSAGWVSTEYNNQNSPSTFYSVGAQECMNPPDTSSQMRHGEYFNACGRQGFTW